MILGGVAEAAGASRSSRRSRRERARRLRRREDRSRPSSRRPAPGSRRGAGGRRPLRRSPSFSRSRMICRQARSSPRFGAPPRPTATRWSRPRPRSTSRVSTTIAVTRWMRVPRGRRCICCRARGSWARSVKGVPGFRRRSRPKPTRPRRRRGACTAARPARWPGGRSTTSSATARSTSTGSCVPRPSRRPTSWPSPAAHAIKMSPCASARPGPSRCGWTARSRSRTTPSAARPSIRTPRPRACARA